MKGDARSVVPASDMNFMGWPASCKSCSEGSTLHRKWKLW